jgi:ZIP family zinc transporter
MRRWQWRINVLLGAALPLDTVFIAVVAGLAASLACGLGVLPLLLRRIDPAHHAGMGYGLAGGLMFAASVYNLILPGLEIGGGERSLRSLLTVVGGILAGCAFIALVERHLPHESASDDDKTYNAWGGRVGMLVFIAMCAHSIPEGVAVGVGYTSDKLIEGAAKLGPTLALAIAIHNIPEGLAVAIPMRSRGASITRCFWAAVLTSLPQPLAAIPAVLLAWFFNPLMPIMMGFAAGAMIFLVVLELIPQALAQERPTKIAWSFVIGFCAMIMIQIAL